MSREGNSQTGHRMTDTVTRTIGHDTAGVTDPTFIDRQEYHSGNLSGSRRPLQQGITYDPQARLNRHQKIEQEMIRVKVYAVRQLSSEILLPCGSQHDRTVHRIQQKTACLKVTDMRS